ncbi:MAG TPA: hypothetical protein VHM25_15600 [Polyangiaceae bacterium]|jgi:hypothetical protein|nr:hypothetical protein [Polyangiaceae bacterium]
MRGLLHKYAVGMLALASLVGTVLSLKGCALSFDDYPIGDLCAASEDAGFHPSTAPDPALRGCDAGMAAKDDASSGAAGAADMDGGS